VSTADQSLPHPDAGSAPAPVPTKPYVDVYDPMYPDTDGKPMAEGTQQFDWIVTIKEGLEALFQDVPDVFIAGDLLWYFTQGEPRDCVAPDAMVVFGRPKGHRHSYRQWLEGVVPQVVFEVHSPSNTIAEMAAKQKLYDRLGVQEYYEYDPKTGLLQAWVREEGRLRPVTDVEGWRSPRLGVTFEAPPEPDALIVRRPDGVPFVTAAKAIRERDRADSPRRRGRAAIAGRASARPGRPPSRRTGRGPRRGRARTSRRSGASRRSRASAGRAAGGDVEGDGGRA